MVWKSSKWLNTVKIIFQIRLFKVSGGPYSYAKIFCVDLIEPPTLA